MFPTDYPIVPEIPLVKVVKVFNETDNSYAGFHLECSFKNVTVHETVMYEVSWLVNQHMLKEGADYEFNDKGGVSLLFESDFQDVDTINQVGHQLITRLFIFE